MDIRQSGSIIEVDGVIKTINDSQMLVNAIKDASKNGSVVVKVNDSFSLPSTVIGELLKIKDNGVNVTLEVKDEKIEYNGENQFAKLLISKSEKYTVVDLEDNGDGFDVSKILKSEWFNKYHGRGIKMLKKLSDGIYYNQKGNRVKLYFKL